MILEPSSVLVDRIIALALEEDLGSGDLTTEACIDEEARAVAHAVARQPVVVCGGSVFNTVVTSPSVLPARVVSNASTLSRSEISSASSA